MQFASIEARTEGSTLPGLSVAALACGEGSLRCSLRGSGCDGPAWAAERGPCISPSRRSCADAQDFPPLRCAARRRQCAPSGHCPRSWAPIGFLGLSNTRCGCPQGCGRAGPGANCQRRAAQRRGGSPPYSAGRRERPMRRRVQRRRGAIAAAPRSEQRRAPGPQGRVLAPERTGLPARSLARSGKRRDTSRKSREARRVGRCA